MQGYIYPTNKIGLDCSEIYNGYYCGICKSIGTRYGQVFRYSLNYESTFFAVLLCALDAVEPIGKHGNCLKFPLRRDKYAYINNNIIDYAADMNMLYAYLKFKDDWNDERTIKSGAMTLLHSWYYRVLRKKYSEKCRKIEGHMAELTKLEKEKCTSIDEVAMQSGGIFEAFLGFEGFSSDDRTTSKIKTIGNCLGKWIYILDAYEDIEEDYKENKFNPFISRYNYNGEDVDKFKDKFKTSIEFLLNYYINEIGQVYKELQIKRNNELLDNILLKGMMIKSKIILRGGKHYVKRNQF